MECIRVLDNDQIHIPFRGSKLTKAHIALDGMDKARLSIVQDLIHLQPPVDMGVEHTTMMEERDVDRGLRLMAPRF
ncbi:kinesin-like protein KIN-13A isoform X1 [Iris pallida]|uniref:Kinesin-like protein KIN-13A isoform X1 n=1 Tax=Iris pallida TaxID=29817 RepID=A0AAX6I1X8_IRIPA|nr:kinesin-like protein KIN-13A isoform X1 [Iris pallida]